MNPRTIEEQLEFTLDHLPTAFAKLAFLTAVRDPYTGKYLHEGWVSIGTPEEIHELLRRTHHEIFDSVTGFPIAQLCAAVKMYLNSLSTPLQDTARLWSELESYREMIPAGICGEGRDLFVSQMRAAVSILIIVPEWAPIQGLSSSRLPPPGQQYPHHLEI